MVGVGEPVPGKYIFVYIISFLQKIFINLVWLKFS